MRMWDALGRGFKDQLGATTLSRGHVLAFIDTIYNPEVTRTTGHHPKMSAQTLHHGLEVATENQPEVAVGRFFPTPT